MKLLLPLILIVLQAGISYSVGEDNDLSITKVEISQRGTIDPPPQPVVEKNEECSVAKGCEPGLIVPVWQPQVSMKRRLFIMILSLSLQHGLSVMEKGIRATIYLFAMFYMFFGVSIVADR